MTMQSKLLQSSVLLLFTAPWLVAPDEAAAELGNSIENEGVTRVREVEVCEDAIQITYDLTDGKVYLEQAVGRLEITDRFLTVGFGETTTSVDVDFRVAGGDGKNWHVVVEAGTVSEEFPVNIYGRVGYVIDPPDEDDIPTLDVYFRPPNSALPTVPDIIIQPLPECPDTVGDGLIRWLPAE